MTIRPLLIRSLLAGLCLPFSASTAPAPRPADLVVRGARVITMDSRQPQAAGFAVADGRFVAVGKAEDLTPYIGPATRVQDVSGLTIIPGFNDAHIHPGPVYPEDSRWASVDCSPRAIRTIDEMVAALRRKAERTPPGQWVNGTRYQETKLGRQPTRHDLDRASTNHPIIISHSSGHQSVCNSLALELARVNRNTQDPPGGRFGRDTNGELTGLLQERAAGMVRSAVRREVSPPEDAIIAGYRECFRQYLRRGLTSIQVAGTSPSAAKLLEKARTDEVPIRLSVMFREESLSAAAERKRAGRVEDPVRYGAIKLFHGNSLSAQTCWLSKPYSDRPDNFGVPPARSQEALDRLILQVHTNGLQAAVHSNGDREIEMLVTAFERALAQAPRSDHRHRIEHGSVLTAELLPRIKAAGLIVVPHSYIWEHGDKMENYGAWRWEWMHPARALLDAGIPIASHSDAPVSAAEPLLRVQDMVTRTSAEGKVYGGSQRISVDEALRSWTLGSAYAEFAEQQKGSITVGKLADFVVLAADPTKVPPASIKDIDVRMTFVGGRRVFEAKSP